MKIIGTWLLILLLARAGQAQLQVVPGRYPQAVFGGTNQSVMVQFQNVSPQPFEAEVRMILLQTSAATAVRSGEWAWKKLLVWPGQTVLETATFPFPVVRAETRFLIQWVAGASNVLGRTEVLVYPVNLLHGLKAMAEDSNHAVGIFDPENQLKPGLRAQGIEFVDLETEESFRGRLAIFGAVTGKGLQSDLRRRVETLARKRVAVVWLQAAPESSWSLLPSFYCVVFGEVAVVVVPSELGANLASNPQAQLNLLQLCRLALKPEVPQLSQFVGQP